MTAQPTDRPTDRTFAGVSGELDRWLWKACYVVPDEMGVWERIWIAAGFLTGTTFPNGIARIRRDDDQPSTAIVPGYPHRQGQSRQKSRALWLERRNFLFEQMFLELMKYGTRDERIAIFDAWERQGRPRPLTDAAKW